MSSRHHIRNFNMNRLKETTERNQGSKLFARDMYSTQRRLTKLKKEDGSVTLNKAEVLKDRSRGFINSYSHRYTSVTKSVNNSAKDLRAELT